MPTPLKRIPAGATSSGKSAGGGELWQQGVASSDRYDPGHGRHQSRPKRWRITSLVATCSKSGLNAAIVALLVLSGRRGGETFSAPRYSPTAAHEKH
jgi:hypothetical protein